MNAYEEMKQRQQQEVNAFPMFFAFDNKALREGLAKLGLGENDTDKICHIGGGGYIKKTDLPELKEMLSRHREERDAAAKADTAGTGFAYYMFFTELNNHEFGYTGEYEETLEALGYTQEDLDTHPALQNAFTNATAKILGWEG